MTIAASSEPLKEKTERERAVMMLLGMVLDRHWAQVSIKGGGLFAHRRLFTLMHSYPLMYIVLLCKTGMLCYL